MGEDSLLVRCIVKMVVLDWWYCMVLMLITDVGGEDSGDDST